VSKRTTTARRLRGFNKAVLNSVAGVATEAMFKIVRAFEPHKAARLAARMMRRVGPYLPEHKIGRDNLAAAFPDWSADKIETVLGGVWDNLGRLGVEFANLDRLWQIPEALENGQITVLPGSMERFHQLRDSGRPGLIFAAHLANWEMPAVSSAAYGLDTAVLFRRPNIARADKLVRGMREKRMGELIATTLDAPMKLTNALQRGTHVGILVDQYYVRGVEVTFFGRRTMANPLIARLAQHGDYAIHGVRAIRLPDDRFALEMTEEVVPPRDADGKVDVAATMQTITSVVETWVREYPEQWLWLHRRWR
jgi:KDO2-lipid IV(A) lauroyltransferase